MIRAQVIKKFHYVKVYPKLHVQLGIAPSSGMSHHNAKVGDVMEFETHAAFEEMAKIATKGNGALQQVK